MNWPVNFVIFYLISVAEKRLLISAALAKSAIAMSSTSMFHPQFDTQIYAPGSDIASDSDVARPGPSTATAGPGKHSRGAHQTFLRGPSGEKIEFFFSKWGFLMYFCISERRRGPKRRGGRGS